MANKTIKDFPESTSPSGEWYVLVDDGTGCYYKVKLKNLPGGGFTTTSTTTTAAGSTTTSTTSSTTTSGGGTTSTTTTAVAPTTTTTTSSTSSTTTSSTSSTTSTTTTIIYDTDAQAFFTAIEGAGGSLTVNEKLAVNTMVLSFKADNVWTKLKAVYPFVGGSATSHKFNLINPADTDGAFRMTFQNAVTHNTNGVTFNGVNSYGDTKFAIEDFISTTNMSYGVYIRSGWSNIVVGDIGVYDSTFPAGYSSIWASIRRFFPNAFGNQWTPAYSLGDPLGFVAGVIRGASDAETYKNGASVLTQTTPINSDVPQTGVSWYLGAVNDGTGTAVDFAPHNYAFAYLGDAFSDAEMSNLYSAVQTCQTSLGRQI